LLDDAPKTQEPVKTEAPAAAPETYADFTRPEGVEIDAEIHGKFTGIAKELGLSQENAQKVYDLGAEMAVKQRSAIIEQIETQAREWEASVASDKEYGGPKLQENMATAKKALDAFATPELKTLLSESRLIHHPEVVRLLHRVGKAISQDTAPLPSAAGGTPNANKTYSERYAEQVLTTMTGVK
jgi:hypothetical protein